MCTNSRASPRTDHGPRTKPAWCCPTPSANCKAGSSAWSVWVSSAAARRALPRPSACGFRSPIGRGARRKQVACRSMSSWPVRTFVSLHCPLNDATRGLIGARELELMKPDALLINTARGALIDGPALAAALKAGQLGGAGIDVLPQEPPPDGEAALGPPNPQSIGDAAHRLGSTRSAAALRRRDGRKYPRFPERRAARPRSLGACLTGFWRRALPARELRVF